MIYSIGMMESYEPYIASDPKAAKGIGGSVWKTRADVQAYLDSCEDTTGWAVYGVEASWEDDTKANANPDAAYRDLIRTGKLVKLT